MLQSLHQLLGYHVHATDGDLGHVHDLYFDDQTWAVRYIVVDTRHWLNGRRVLLAPQMAGPPNPAARRLPMTLSKDQIRTSPNVSTDLPVARRHEAALAQHYGWIAYWDQPGASFLMSPQPPPAEIPQEDQDQGDPHLRSLREVLHYEVRAADGLAGNVGDFLGDTADWTIRGVVVVIGPLLHRKKVLMPPADVQSIVWPGVLSVCTKLNCTQVEQLPPYDAEMPSGGQTNGLSC